MYLNTLDICFRWILSHVWSGQSLEGSAPILRVLLSFDVSDLFWRRLQSGQKIFLSFLCELAWVPYDIHGGYPLLSLGVILSVISSLLLLSVLRTSDHSFGGASRGLFLPKFSLILGVFWSSRKDCWLRATSREVFFLPSVVLISRQRRFFQDYSLLPGGIFSVIAVSSCSVRRRGKHSGNWSIF